MASEVLCRRWTILVVRELLAGSTRFNDLRRGVPRMSPALLSKRLRELEEAGLLDHVAVHPKGHEYRLTEAGLDLGNVVGSIGIWGQRWVETRVTLRNLDPSLLMWDMRRNLNLSPMPGKKSVVQFLYPELAEARRNWWLIVEPESPAAGPSRHVDLCSVDPGFDVDLFVTCDLRTMTAIWMGLDKVGNALEAERLSLSGDRGLAKNMQTWLGLSPFAVEKKRIAT